MSTDYRTINLKRFTIHEESFKNITVPISTLYSNIPMSREHIKQWILHAPMKSSLFYPRIPVGDAMHSPDALLRVVKTSKLGFDLGSIVAEISIMLFRREIDSSGPIHMREYDAGKWDSRETYEQYAMLHLDVPILMKEESAVYGVHPDIEDVVHRILFTHHDDFASICRMVDIFDLGAFTDKRTLMFHALISMTVNRDLVPAGISMCAPTIVSGNGTMCALCCKLGATDKCGCGVFYCDNNRCRKADWPKHRSVHVFGNSKDRQCARCGYEGRDHNKQCSGCKRVYYCCKECQNADWPDHRPECKK